MKKHITIIIAVLTFSALKAQETTPEDALRYAVENITGSARFRGMGGAFGAVGGDLSALNQNPAGSLFFNNNYATATASINNTKNSSLYNGTRTKDNDSSLDLNQAGVVFVFNDTSGKSNWKKIAIAFNYENTNNFNNSIFSAGTNQYNSIGNYFVNQANANGGIPLELLTLQPGETFYELYDYLGTLPDASYPNVSGFQAQQAFLGYTTYLFDSNSPNTYNSNVPAANYSQQNYYTSTGYNGKITGNFATQYKDILFLGLNINAHFTDYVRTTSLREQNDGLAANGVSYIRFDNQLHTYGSGFSFNLGAIVKIVPQFRVGLAYESPTWYRLTDELAQYVDSDYSTNSVSNTYVADPDIINVYAPYKIQTPSKWTGSMAYLFGKKGIVSVDVSTKDYSTTRFKPKNEYPYAGLNQFMKNNLENAVEVRVGGEYKIKQVSLRGGYHFDQSPYKVDQTFGDLTGYSAGVGYSFGESKIDLAYSYEHRNMNQPLISSGQPDPARISRYNNNIIISYSVNF
ncbi:transporter [Flavobacterium sp. AS60]|uniref:OmpP1/FadL family transporter n=1 Tax=Flavobacterium anseongense TaxID=2910677 RepID=UPI001F2F70FC|nr:transporter [Flavobacterium sp. AS60]MCF6130007.1 transporter [Flavobacterium sp. AS60]